jgi:hypothetical protein
VRQLYASPRVENIERLDAALKEIGIQTRVTNRKSFLTGTPYFGYSERNTESQWPAVWIVEADDYPRARQLLREVGLLEAPGEISYFRETRAPVVHGPDHVAKRIRLVLFVVVFALAIVTVLKMTVWK